MPNPQPTTTVARGALYSPPLKLQKAVLENGADPDREDKSDLSSGSSILWSGDRIEINGLPWYFFSEEGATYSFSGWAALDRKGALCGVAETIEEAWDLSPKSGDLPEEA